MINSNHPEAVVGAFIFNDKGQILLVRSPKWLNGNEWLVAGGHIEFGETIEAALKREVKEELGIRVRYDGLITVMEDIFPFDFKIKKHFLYFQCRAYAFPDQIVRVDGREIVEAKWWNIEDVLRLPPNQLKEKTREVLEKM